MYFIYSDVTGFFVAHEKIEKHNSWKVDEFQEVAKSKFWVEKADP